MACAYGSAVTGFDSAICSVKWGITTTKTSSKGLDIYHWIIKKTRQGLGGWWGTRLIYNVHGQLKIQTIYSEDICMS